MPRVGHVLLNLGAHASRVHVSSSSTNFLQPCNHWRPCTRDACAPRIYEQGGSYFDRIFNIHSEAGEPWQQNSDPLDSSYSLLSLCCCLRYRERRRRQQQSDNSE